MFKIVTVFILSVALFKENTANAPGESWVSLAQVVNPIPYFTEVIQEFCYELERRGWSNLKLTNLEQQLDTVTANWHARGPVNYTNGFVVSIQKIDVTDVASSVTRVIEDNVVIPSASVSGTLHFRHVKLGYDVTTNFEGMSEMKYTGEFLTKNVAFQFTITKNLITEEMTTVARVTSVEGAGRRMIYRPEDRVTEVLSRSFQAFNTSAGINTWVAPFRTIILDVAQNKVPFPRTCFNDCT